MLARLQSTRSPTPWKLLKGISQNSKSNTEEDRRNMLVINSKKIGSRKHIKATTAISIYLILDHMVSVNWKSWNRLGKEMLIAEPRITNQTAAFSHILNQTAQFKIYPQIKWISTIWWIRSPLPWKPGEPQSQISVPKSKLNFLWSTPSKPKAFEIKHHYSAIKKWTRRRETHFTP